MKNPIILCDGKEVELTSLLSTQELIDELRDRMAGVGFEQQNEILGQIVDGTDFYIGW